MISVPPVWDPLMINISDPADIGPVSITTDPKTFQQDLQELFVQVGARTGAAAYLELP